MKQTDHYDLKANKVLPKMGNHPMALAGLDQADLVLEVQEVEWEAALEAEWAVQIGSP